MMSDGMNERAETPIRLQNMLAKVSLVATVLASAITGIGEPGSSQEVRLFVPAIKVVDQDGRPVSRASVLVVPRPLTKNAYRNNGETTADGVYSIGFPNQNIDLYISDGIRVTRKTIRSLEDYRQEPLVFRLRKPGAVAMGRVVDEKGNPVSSASVKCFRRIDAGGMYVGEVKSDVSGKFSFSGLWDAFDYSFETYAEGFGRVQALVSHKVREGRTADIGVVKLPAANSYIEVEVIDEWGRLLSDAQVSMVVYPEKSGTTDSVGQFRATGLPPGVHMVSVFQGGQQVSETIQSGKKTRIMLTKR